MATLLRRIVLASASPRRRELLANVGIDVVVAPVDADETIAPGENPADYVRRIARMKRGLGLARAEEDDIVVAADTIVSLDGIVLGKPVDDDDARRILGALSGLEHVVTTAVAVGSRDQRLEVSVSTKVSFRTLDAAMIERYIATGEGRDKAGSYGIQGIGSGLVTAIEGSYPNVVGLPVAETLALLVEIGAIGSWP